MSAPLYLAISGKARAAASIEALVLEPDRDWLAARIDRRFDAMMAAGALEEVRAALPAWHPGAPWTR